MQTVGIALIAVGLAVLPIEFFVPLRALLTEAGAPPALAASWHYIAFSVGVVLFVVGSWLPVSPEERK